MSKSYRLVEVWRTASGAVVAAIRENEPNAVSRVVNVSLSLAAAVETSKETRSLPAMLCYASDHLGCMSNTLMLPGDFENLKISMPANMLFQIHESQQITLELQAKKPAIQVT